MCVLKLAKGFLVGLITFILGFGVVSLFISQEQTSNQSKTICVKEENPFENYEDGKMVRIPCEIDNEINVLEKKIIPQGFVEKVEKPIDWKERKSRVIGCGESFSKIYKELYKGKKELKKELLQNYSIKTEQEIEKINRQIQIVKDLELRQKNTK